MSPEQLSEDDVITHLNSYLARGKTQRMRLESYYPFYLLKKEGIDDIIGQMRLSDSEQKKLKGIISQIICMKEALDTQWIPTKFIPYIIESLPEEAKKIYSVRIYDDFYGSVSNPRCFFKPEAPAPFNPEGERPYKSVCREGAELVKIAQEASEKAVKLVLNTPERVEFFNKLIMYSSN
ncbi:hypothetical protein J4209_04090 [Candidatus Woesearchaeota archaeon]|nr:hypothetical protein [Candidatus Woesearchaeota archaeon]